MFGDSGGLALMAKGLVQAKAVARRAFDVLWRLLLSVPTEQRDVYIQLLARMQGVRRLSNLICPTYSDWQQGELAWGMAMHRQHA